MLNHFGKHKVAFAVSHLCISVLLPSKKLYLRKIVRLLLLFGMMAGICIQPEN